MAEDREARRRMAPQTQNSSPMATRALRRQSPKVGAVCGKAACTDLCGGTGATRFPTAITLCRAWHLWICGQPLRGCLCRQCVKPGLPTTPQAHHQRKEGAILFSVGRVLCRMTRFHRGTLPLAYAPGVEQERSGQITS